MAVPGLPPKPYYTRTCTGEHGEGGGGSEEGVHAHKFPNIIIGKPCRQ